MVNMALDKERKDQILEIAANNNGHISYTVAIDILKDHNREIIDDQYLQEAFEELTREGVDFETKEESEDYQENCIPEIEPFVPADVHITPRPITIDAVVSRLRYKEIDLTPEFQRKGGLWSEVQQSRLIESLMLKIPIPTFYFNAVDDANWVVIDGLQRLTTLYNFMVKGTLKLQGLEYLKEFEGSTFENLPRQYYRRICETQLQIYTIERGTPEEVVFNIFKRINTGGLNLEPQEIRHALYQGKSTRLVKRLAGSEAFLEATAGAIRTERMMDCEFVTRYLAFTELDYQKDYKGNIDSYLIKVMKLVNTYTDDQIEKIAGEFIDVMQTCHQILGRYAFRKVNIEYRRGSINKAVFEMWVHCIYQCTESERDQLILKRELVLVRFIELLQQPDMISAIKSGDKYSVMHRINDLRELLREICND